MNWLFVLALSVAAMPLTIGPASTQAVAPMGLWHLDDVDLERYCSGPISEDARRACATEDAARRLRDRTNRGAPVQQPPAEPPARSRP